MPSPFDHLLRCPDCKKSSVLVRVPTSRLAESLGRIETQCDTCKKRFSIDTKGMK
jgi:transcriptional regulator NrdR family protein